MCLLLSVPDESTQDMGPMETRLEGWQIRRLSLSMFSLTRRRMKTLRVPTHVPEGGLRWWSDAVSARESPLLDSAYFALVFVFCAKLDLAALGGACVLLFSFSCSRKARKTWANGNPRGRLENSVTSFRMMSSSIEDAWRG